MRLAIYIFLGFSILFSLASIVFAIVVFKQRDAIRKEQMDMRDKYYKDYKERKK